MRNERVAERMDVSHVSHHHVRLWLSKNDLFIEKSFSREKLYKINNTLTFLSVKVYDIGFEYIISAILIYVFAVVMCCTEGDPQSHIW